MICNLLIRPVNPKWYMSQEDVARLQAASASKEAGMRYGSFGIGTGGLSFSTVLFWVFVGIPISWGVWQTLLSVAKIF